MPKSLDEELLSAYLDDALAAPERGALETRLAEEPALAQALEDLRDADGDARAWFEAALAPPSERAIATIQAARERSRWRGNGASAWGPWLLPVAASLAILVAGMFTFQRMVDVRVEARLARLETRQAEDMRLLSEAVQTVLETRESGVPVGYVNEATGFVFSIQPQRTWRSESGHWCREFVETFENAARPLTPVSVACRDEKGVWTRLNLRLDDPGPDLLPAVWGRARL